jgi:hypothetical protein
MSLLKKAWFGEYSLGFTFWIMGCVVPTPIFAAKYYLREAGIFTHGNTAVFLAGQSFLWLEWLYFVFITVALWNSSIHHLSRAARGGKEQALWGQLCRLLAIASGLLAIGSFANLSGLTTLVFGEPRFIGLGAG